MSYKNLNALTICALAAAAIFAGSDRVARAQSPVTFTQPTNCSVRIWMVGREGNFLVVPCTVSAELSGPPASGSGTMTIRAFHVALVNCAPLVPLTGGQIPITLTQLVCNAAPAGATLTATPGTGDAVNFAGTGISTAATGTVTYTAINLACRELTLGGGQCSGPFNLATPGANTSARVDAGVVQPASGGTHAVTFQFRASFPMVSGATWGRVDLLANLSGTIPAGGPVCPPDVNGADGVTVQDIFDFLAAWFAGQAAGDFNHADGVTVQDIFDFLSAWFAGC